MKITGVRFQYSIFDLTNLQKIRSCFELWKNTIKFNEYINEIVEFRFNEY